VWGSTMSKQQPSPAVFDSVSKVSARLGQPRRRQSSNSARQMREAFWEMYELSAIRLKESMRFRLMYTWQEGH